MTNVLINKTIKEIKIADDRMALLFIFDDDSSNIALCDADCCSETWIESIELPALGFPAKVLSVQNLEMPDLGDMDGRDVVSYYGCKIVTDKGNIVIDYRNDSNGYYGGSLSFGDDYHYGGVHDQNVSNQKWVNIKEVGKDD